DRRVPWYGDRRTVALDRPHVHLLRVTDRQSTAVRAEREYCENRRRGVIDRANHLPCRGLPDERVCLPVRRDEAAVRAEPDTVELVAWVLAEDEHAIGSAAVSRVRANGFRVGSAGVGPERYPGRPTCSD